MSQGWITAEYLSYRLDRAGETLMSLPGRGCFPGGFRSGMPEYIHLPSDDDANHKLNPLTSASDTDRPRPPVPSREAVSEMDVVYLEWLPLLPSETDLQRQAKRIIQLRSLVWPGSERQDPHVWSWRRLADLLGPHHETIRDRHALALDRLVSRINRLPLPCAATLSRALAFNRQAATVREMDAMTSRPRPAPCAATLARIAGASARPARVRVLAPAE